MPKSNFQLILIIIFMGAGVFALLVFAGVIKIGKDKTQSGAGSTIVLWGTDKNELISQALEDFNNSNQGFTIKYVQKSADTFDQSLLEALATGTGPDIFLLPSDLAYHYKDKIFGVPFQNLSLATFKTSFASVGEVFVNSKGILAIPLAIDPIVMFYNRSMLDSAGIVYPPATWDQFSDIVPLLTEKDDDKKILTSAVALGQFSNITNAKDITASMFLQTGNRILAEAEDGSFVSTLENSNQINLSSILQFYTDFSDPLNENYSWNRSLPNSIDFFSADKLAFYFGHASESQYLINKNPNQNFSIAYLPQIKGLNSKSTYAKVTGIALSAHTKNFDNALAAASAMAMSDFATKYASLTGTAPARRDLLNVKQLDVSSSVIFNSALFARSWLDPSPKDTDDIFRTMINGVLSNSMSFNDAVRDAHSQMNLLLLKK
jgi:multiple sugar transport system substrate-binding protein